MSHILIFKYLFVRKSINPLELLKFNLLKSWKYVIIKLALVFFHAKRR